MGIRHLSSFIRNCVPGGFVPVNIQEEIRNASSPVIVIDLISLYVSLSEQDIKGTFLGGRYNLAYVTIDKFFSKLVSLGAKLVFFYDGPIQNTKNETWLRRQDERYERYLRLVDAVDQGTDIDHLASSFDPPHNFRYPLKYLARKHGTFVLSMANECDQELASYASKVGALAILATDSDYLAYEGDWRLWFSEGIDFDNLKTMEFNRKALLSHLGLNCKQMPLFGTLAGNDILRFDDVKGFLKSLGHYDQKFYNLARFVQEQTLPFDIDGIMQLVFRYRASNQELRERFTACLRFYQTISEAPNRNPDNDTVQGFLLRQDTPLFYQIWHGTPIDLTLGLVDISGKIDFGPNYNDLLVTPILRMAGIIRYHRREQLGSSTCEFLTKLNHDDYYKRYTLRVIFPERIVPPPLAELTSQEPDICQSYLDIKYQLCGWVVSDMLNSLALKLIPRQFLVTVLTLSYLVDMRVIEISEADLFLQMAYDMTYETYDMHSIRYPQRTAGRPFRLAFIYQRVYVLVAKVVHLVGLDEQEFRDDPIYDGALFHSRYESWRNPIELELIKEWRVYDFNKFKRQSTDLPSEQ